MMQVTDYRTQFSKWWISEWKTVAFPEKGLVFDYYVDEAQVIMPGAAALLSIIQSK
jgi:dynein heavy chain